MLAYLMYTNKVKYYFDKIIIKYTDFNILLMSPANLLILQPPTLR